MNGNVGAGVAVAGTFSLVRFRSVPGTAKEIGTIFLAMASGLICGMGYLAYGMLFSLTLGAVQVKTTNMGSLFKLTYHVTEKNPEKEKEFVDLLRCRNGNLEITISNQDSSVMEL